MKCINCGYEWQAEEKKIVTCPFCGLEAEYVKDENGYERALIAEREGKISEAVRGYTAAAEDDIPCAAYAVYRLLQNRTNRTERDVRFWLRVAADSGDPIACYLLSKQYQKEKKADRARFYLQKSADGGHEAASMETAWRLFCEKDKDGSRFYLHHISKTNRFAALLLFFLGRKAKAKQPQAVPPPDKAESDCRMGEKAQARGLHRIAYRYFTAAGTLSKALYYRGCYDLDGTVTQNRSFEAIAKDLMMAGKNGFPDAFMRLGKAFEQGLVTEENKDAALRCYRMAAEAGIREAQKLLGDSYYTGLLSEIDVEKAIMWYEKAAAQGDKDAAEQVKQISFALSSAFKKAKEAQACGENEKAFMLYTKCAEMGHTPSCCNLGMCYQCGDGCKQSFAKSATLYEKAAQRGSMAAVYNLGMLYAENCGVRFSCRKAIKLLELAAPRGYEQANEVIARLKAARKKRLTRRVYACGCSLYFEGHLETAIKYIVTAAGLGYPKALYLLGCITEFGDGVPQDAEKAKRYYEKAAALGFDGGRGRIKSGYLRTRARLAHGTV